MPTEIQIEDHFGLIGLVLRSQKSILAALHIEPDDAFQIGAVGLVRAIHKFNPAKGAFSTFACRLIREEIIKTICHYNAKCRQGYVVSLNAQVINGRWRSEYQELIDYGSPDPAETVLSEITLDEFSQQLTERERIVFDCLRSSISKREQLRRLSGLSERGMYLVLNRLKSKVRSHLDIKKAAL